jgi:murein DD-endopeptidase MepM/ murein hydrolase activator NlpD
MPPLGKVEGQGGEWLDESISGCGLARDHAPSPGLRQTLVAAEGLHWYKESIMEKRRERCHARKCFLIAGVAALFLLMGAGTGLALPKPEITFSSDSIFQGDVGLLRVQTTDGESPHVQWMNQELFMAPSESGKAWVGFFGADLKLKPGSYALVVKTASTGFRKQIDVTVRSKDFGVRQLTLPKEMVDLDPVTLERVKREAAVMKEVLEAPPAAPQWQGPFVKPVSGEVIGPFGQASIINGMPRAPHSGVDLKGERGTPVASINSGRVALTGEHFFNGLFVVIDHGGAIQSMYFHLDKILVQQGDRVTKGQSVGLLGATGRATGPHLHFGIRVNGARIDPLEFMKVSEAMERL